MNQTDDPMVVQLIERSVLVRMMEQGAAKLAQFARTSLLLGLALPLVRRTADHGAIVVLAAVITHVLLMAVVADPAAAYWLILPAIAGALAALSLVVKARAADE